MTVRLINLWQFNGLQYWVTPLAIFVLALLLRAPALGQFLTVDEPFWADRSRIFAAGLLYPDYECPPLPRDGRNFASQGWGCTFQTAHPGVTTMWAGSVGLLLHYWQSHRSSAPDFRTYLQSISTDPLDATLIAPLRLPLAISGAIFVAIFYLWLRWLVPHRVALLTALLLALNPFHLALSRVLHQDALTAMFMSLALLALIGYWLCGWPWRWLLISAVCTGLACLSKPVGWFMAPYAGLMGCLTLLISGSLDRPKLTWVRVIVAELGWVGMVAITFLVFFPAMWVNPLEVLSGIFTVSLNYSEAGQIDGHYFLGQIARDPGLLFYPITWLWRTSPLELLGLVALIFSWLFRWNRLALQPSRQSNNPAETTPIINMSLPHPEAQVGGRWSAVGSLSSEEPSQPRLVWIALALFVVFFLIFVSLSSKKMDRYFLPAFPAMHAFAALGLVWGADKVGQLINVQMPSLRVNSSVVFGALAGLVLLVQSGLAWLNYPYYFTYYNPLLGGALSAARLMTIFGWGEGLDVVATFLNQQPQAKSLRVVAAYEDTLKPFFDGQLFSSRDAGEILSADFVVYYRNQLQRKLQNIDAWRYYNEHATPAYRVTMQGLDYALVYHTPIQHQVVAKENSLPQTATLGYNLATDGQLTLFWQNFGLGQPIWAGLHPAAGGAISWLPCALDPAFTSEAAIPGAILETQCMVSLAKAKPGLYDLRLGAGEATSITPIDFPAGRLALSIESNGSFVALEPNAGLQLLVGQILPPEAIPLDVTIGQVARLVGYQLELDSWRPGSDAGLWFYWQSVQQVELTQFGRLFKVRMSLSSALEESVLTTSQPLIPPDLATKGLARGAIAPVRYSLALPDALAAGDYALEVCALAGEAQTTAVDQLLTCLPLTITITTP